MDSAQQNQLVHAIDRVTNAISPGGASGTPVTVTSTNAVAGATIAAGALAVTFTTSSDYSGNINGIARDASVSYVFNATSGRTLPAIAYTITTGSIKIDVIS